MIGRFLRFAALAALLAPPRGPASLAFAPSAFADDAPGGAPGAPAAPASPKDVDARVTRLLAQVASDDFRAREQARKDLAALGPSARTALEAHREDPDPEIRRTVRALLDAMGDATGGTDAPAEPASDLASLDLVTLSGEAPLPDVLHAWEAARVGRFRFVASPPTATVRIEAKDRPWFEVLDAILLQAGADLLDGFDQAGVADVVARRAEVAPPPAAYVGPLKLSVETVSSGISLKNPGPRTYSLGLRLAWAPDVQVVSSGVPALGRAVDPSGKAFVSHVQSPDPTLVRSFGSSRRSTDLTLTLEAADGSVADRIAEAEVKVRLRVRHGREEISFDDLVALPATKTRSTTKATTKAGAVTLGELGPDPDHTGWLLARLVVSLPPGASGDSVVTVLEGSDGSVRTLFDWGLRSVGSDGVLQMTVRTSGLPAGATPRRLSVSWLAREGQGVATFVLKDVPLR